MKKFVSGTIFGLVLTLSFNVFSANNLIGQIVTNTFPLIIDGEQSPVDVINLDGTTFLPVRSAGEMFGYNVDFIDRQVILEKEIANTQTTVGDKVQNFIVQEVKIQSDVIENASTEYRIIEIDGEIYVSPTVFIKYNPMWDGKTLTTTLEGRGTVVVPVGQVYSKGVDGFFYQDTSYIRLSAFGLIGELTNDVLWIK